jgi:pyruvate formate lyase activating enzyme
VLLGLQKTSLVDFPGRVSAVLFTVGCNFRCPYCQNPDLVVPPPGPPGDNGFITVDSALSFLKGRVGKLSGVAISGGEPTLHEDLPDLAESIRDLGFAVKMDTNGSFPERISLVGAEYVAMDLKTHPARYPELWPDAPPDAADRIVRSMDAVRGSGSGYEFRITCTPGFINAASIDVIASLLRPEDPVFLQRYREGRVLDQTWASGVSPYPEDVLDGFLATIRKAVPAARLRGL